jgi:transcriptional regulator with XRE-family HTH domain
MSIRSERIKALVEASDLSYQEIEKLTGIKKSSLQRYASGVTSKIPLDVIEKLSSAFNVSQEYLMGWDDQKNISPTEPQLSEGEKAMLRIFRLIPEDQQQVFLEMGRVYANSLKKD